MEDKKILPRLSRKMLESSLLVCFLDFFSSVLFVFSCWDVVLSLLLELDEALPLLVSLAVAVVENVFS